MAGRNSKFTPENRKKLIDAISVGATDKDACGSARIAQSTFYLWLEIGKAHSEDQPHANMPRLIADRDTYSEFLEAINRARSDANNLAMLAFRTGLKPSHIEDVTTETFTETRLDKDNKPYVYRRTVSRETTRTVPADWRAGEAWLKRRDKDNWSERTENTGKDGGAIEHNVTVDDFADLFRSMGDYERKQRGSEPKD